LIIPAFFINIAYAANVAPITISLNPSYGSIQPNIPITFTTIYSDSNGFQDLQTLRLLINTKLDSRYCVYVHYNQNTNKLYLLNDTGTSWLGGFTPGSINTIENTYGKLDCSKTTVTSLGNTITVKWNIAFKNAFITTKTKNLYLYATDDTGANSSFAQKGTYLVGPNTTPSIGTINPASGSSLANTPITFTTTYTDLNSYQDIQNSFLLINASLTGANCLYVYYSQNTNKLYLRNDANASWLGGFTPGSTNTIENSYAKLNCALSTVSGSGNTLTIKWSVSFKDAFISPQTKNTYLCVTDDALVSSGWVQKGTYLVGSNTAPQTGTLNPASGSYYTNTPINFTSTYTDINTYRDIQTVRLLINKTLNSINAVYVYYNQNTNKLYLLNDTGTTWLGGFAPGSSNIIENTYGKLDCSQTTVSFSDNTITVKWNIIFKDAFIDGSAKNLYLYATDDSNLNSGFSQKGTISLKSDTTPPTGTIKINNDDQYTNLTSVTLNISAQDNTGGSGLDKMQFSNDNITWSTPEVVMATKTWELTSGDGEKTVYAKFSDKMGNWSSVVNDKIILDTIAPYVDITPAQNPYITTSTYTLSGAKSSDVSAITLEVTPGTVVVGSKTYTSTTWQCQLSNLTEGTISLTVYCWDLAGNPSPVFTSSLIVDKTVPSAPVLTTTQMPSLTNQPTLNLEGTKDADTSIWLNSIELGTKELVPIDRYQRFSCQVTLKEGSNHISLFSKDYAANQSAYLTLPLITLDTLPPLTPTLNQITSPTSNPKCQLQGAKSANSSIWINNEEKVALTSSTNWSYIFNLREGINDIDIFSKDLAGNKSSNLIRTVILKTTPPEEPTINQVLTPTDSQTQTLSGAKSSDTVAVFVECPTATISSVSYPTATTWACTISNLTEGNNRILVIASDSLGNQTEPVEAVIDYAPLTNLTASTSNEVNSDVVILQNEVFAIWQDASNSNVYLKYSSDAGKTWRATGNSIGNGYLPRIAVDNSGNIYIVLGGGNLQTNPLDDGGGIYLIKSTDKGLTFGTPVNIGIGYNPVIAISKDGSKAYVSWYRKDVTNSFTVQCRASADSGKTFLPTVQVSDAESLEINPRYGLGLSTSCDGKYVYCAFSRRYDNFYKIAFSKSDDCGATFDTDQNLNPQEHNGYNPQLACFGSNVYCLWQHDAFEHNHIWLRSSSDNGQNFLDALRIDDGDHDTTEYKNPSITVDEKGVIYTAFVNTTNSGADIYMDSSLNNGKNFQDDIRIDGGPAATLQNMPRVASNSTGSVVSVIWQDSRNTNQDIYIRNFKTQTPVDWLKSQICSFGFLDSFQDDGKNVANIYDQALAVIAFTKAGEFQSAKKVLDALKTKQNADGSWYSSYSPTTGENVDSLNSKYVGNVAWVIMAVNFYTNATKDISYANMAKSAAEWCWQFFDNNPPSPTYGSLTGGSLNGTPITWRSTEHNLDAYSAFKYLQKILDENNIQAARNYASAADLIRLYLMSNMYNGERFLTGWQNESMYLDVNSLAILSLGIRPNSIDIRPALNWAFTYLSLKIDWNINIKAVNGFDEMVNLGQAPNKIWCEGTEQMASAYNETGKTDLARRFHKHIQRLQQSNLAVPYSTLGSTDWPRFNSVSSTCWFYFNDHLAPVNPLDPTSINEAVLTVDDFGDVWPHQNSLGFYTDDDNSCLVNEDVSGAHHISWQTSISYWYSVLFNGLVSDTDVSRYKYLSFRIKSSSSAKDFVVRLEDNQNRFDINIKDYAALSGTWQYINIPLGDFVAKGLDATHLRSIAFLFNKDASGEIWFDDMGFSRQLLSPYANITTPGNIYCFIPAQFLSSGSGDYDGGIMWYEWDFGDGIISHEANPIHIYTTPGNYTIFLKVKDSDGLIATAQKAIIVYLAPLISGDLSFISNTNNNLIYKGDVISISSVTTAVEGQNLQHRFKIDGQLVQDYSSNATYDWNTTSVALGKHLVEYDVKDEFGNTVHRQTNVWVYRKPVLPPGE